MSPKGIALFCLDASLRVSLPYNTAFSFGINLGITFSILYVMFLLIVSMRSSNLMYLFCIGYIPLCGLLRQDMHLCWCSVRSWVHGCLFQIRAGRNTRDDFCLTCVEQPSCHSLGMEVAHGLYPHLWQVN